MDKRPQAWYNFNIFYESAGFDMSFSLIPKLVINELTDLTLQDLDEQGVRLLMLDFDNTIVPYTTDKATEKMQLWLQRMVSSHVMVCVVSNSRKDRVRIFCKEYGLPCITHAAKPFGNGIRTCIRKYHVEPSAAALVGDQIYTDILGANLAGATSILVKAIDNHNFWLKARHVLEKPFIFIARNRRITK